MPNLASTAKLRGQVEEFKKARGWNDAQFEAKTIGWDQSDFDELANGFIRQQTLSKRDAQLRKEVEGEKTKLATEYNTKFTELARLQANAKDAENNGSAKAQALANKLVSEFKASALKWAEDNELDATKLMTPDFTSIIQQELGSPNNNNRQPGNNQPANNGNHQPSNGQSSFTKEEVQAMIDNAIGNGAGRLTAIQEKIEDYNDELGLKGRARVTFSKFQSYIGENGIDPSQASVEGILDEMTDAPTKRAKFAEDDREKWYQERHSKELTEAIEKKFGTTVSTQMAASNIPQRPKAAIFRREFAGQVKDNSGQDSQQQQQANNGNNGQQTNNNNNQQQQPEHRGQRPERNLSERRADVMRDINRAFSSGQTGQTG